MSFRIFCFWELPAPSFVAFDGRRGSRHRLGLCRGVEVHSDSVALRLVSSWKMLLGISLEIQCLSSCWKLWKNQGEFLDSNRRGKTNPSTKLLWGRGVGGGETHKEFPTWAMETVCGCIRRLSRQCNHGETSSSELLRCQSRVVTLYALKTGGAPSFSLGARPVTAKIVALRRGRAGKGWERSGSEYLSTLCCFGAEGGAQP